MSETLYRKYRSKNLDEIKGQEHITKVLKNAIKSKAISHAYLFTGPHGVGKTSIARILAHEINKLPYTDESNHIDIIEIDAASNRRIDEIRDLRDKVHIAPALADYKVYIIDEVHMLTKEAFNALLKTLEEPPEHAVFILATTELHKVPSTIVSRTQKFTFRPIGDSHALEHLKELAKKETIAIDDESLKLLITHANGSFRDSISMLDQIKAAKLKSVSVSDIENLLGVPNSQIIDNLLSRWEQNDYKHVLGSIDDLRHSATDPAKTARSIAGTIRAQLANSTIGSARAVQLLKELIPDSGVYASFDHIEIALLSTMSAQKSSTAESRRPVSVEKPEPAPENIEEDQITTESEVEKEPDTIETQPEPVKQETIATSPKKETAAATGDKWTQTLEALKGHHNTLYGILRMSEAAQDGDSLTLTFKFAFHKKQMQQNKHLDILQNTIKDTYGKPLSVDILVAEQKPKQTSKKLNTDDKNQDLETVSNIFAGAELLE